MEFSVDTKIISLPTTPRIVRSPRNVAPPEAADADG
jgi:hypothetical protein